MVTKRDFLEIEAGVATTKREIQSVAKSMLLGSSRPYPWLMLEEIGR